MKSKEPKIGFKKPKFSKEQLYQRVQDLVQDVKELRDIRDDLTIERDDLLRKVERMERIAGGGFVPMIVKFRLKVPSDFDEENVKNAVETVFDEVVRDKLVGDTDTWDMLADMTEVTVTREGK